jgi:hypothetical protein
VRRFHSAALDKRQRCGAKRGFFDFRFRGGRSRQGEIQESYREGIQGLRPYFGDMLYMEHVGKAEAKKNLDGFLGQEELRRI